MNSRLQASDTDDKRGETNEIIAGSRVPEVHLRHLRYFMVAAEEENFNRAAERLNIAQPALSRRIHDLEETLGAQLFERNRKRVKLSGAGQSLLEDLRQIMLDLERAAARCRKRARDETSILSIGINDSALRHEELSRAFRTFRDQNSDVALNIGPTAPLPLIEAVVTGAIDAAFIFTRPADSVVLDHIEVSREQFLLAMPTDHRLAKAEKIRLADLRDEEFLWLPRDSSPMTYDYIINACNAGGLNPRISQYILSESSRLYLVAEGIGLSFVTASFGNFLPDRVALRKVEDFWLELPLDLVWRRDNKSPMLDRFTEIVRHISD